MSEAKPKRRTGALIPWLVISVLTAAIALGLDFMSARPASWLLALPAGRAGIGVGAALFVVASAWLLRLALTRRFDTAAAEDADD
ncbi:MAG: hypothetical protein ABUS57_15650 [Pseudomonadota bacterium]